MEFLFDGVRFNGLNPNAVIFDHQTNQNSCWASCIVNASRVLKTGKDVTDDQILERCFPNGSYNFMACHYNNLIEYISFSSDISFVIPVPKTKRVLPGEIDAVVADLDDGFPSIFYLEFPGVRVGHYVLALAHGGQMGTDYLIFDPQYNVTAPAGSMEAAKQASKEGFKVIDYGVIMRYGKFSFPIKRKI